MAATSPHIFTVGTSGTGKTSLYVSLAAQWMSMRHRGVLVCDPKADPRWRSDRLVTDSATMLALARASSRCHLIIDESGQMIGRYNEDLQWFTTQARGYPWFHVTHLVAQSAKQIYPTVRQQCGTYNVFPIYHGEFEVIGAEMMRPELMIEGPKLKVKPAVWCEFFRVEKFGDMRKLVLDIQSGSVRDAA